MIKRRVYSLEFKEDAVKLLRSSDKPLTHLAKDLGINESVLRKWNVRFDDKNPFPGNGNPSNKEVYDLRKENKILREERDILKKAMAIFSVQK